MVRLKYKKNNEIDVVGLVISTPWSCGSGQVISVIELIRKRTHDQADCDGTCADHVTKSHDM